MRDAVSLIYYFAADAKPKVELQDKFIWIETGSINTGARLTICMTPDQARELAAELDALLAVEQVTA